MKAMVLGEDGEVLVVGYVVSREEIPVAVASGVPLCVVLAAGVVVEADKRPVWPCNATGEVVYRGT